MVYGYDKDIMLEMCCDIVDFFMMIYSITYRNQIIVKVIVACRLHVEFKICSMPGSQDNFLILNLKTC